MIQATLCNALYPECGEATIPFPIPEDAYAHCVRLLEALEAADPIRRDCQVTEITGSWPVLKRLENTLVNLDELDYLAKRLDSFDDGEIAQFQAMAEKLDLHDMTDLINLTFCCQQATVITDFSNLEAIGREHYMNINGGCASSEELKGLDGEETALLLIDGGGGTVTRYGVVYDNGMKLEQLYDGRHLPDYHYEADMLTVQLTGSENSDNHGGTWLYFPTSEEHIDRAIVRSGIDPEELRPRFSAHNLPWEIEGALDLPNENLYELNALTRDIADLSKTDRRKLSAAVELAEPTYAFQTRQLAANLNLFELAPDVFSPADYGRYMIQQSGHFHYDSNLDDFYDYEKYGVRRMAELGGSYTDHGYLTYHGTMSLEELMMEDPAEQYQREQELQMGGMA